MISTDTKAIVEWAAMQPWAVAMRECMQDPEWHAEGDVWTHTLMVIDQLERLSGWDELNVRDRTTLLYAALFHDAGLPHSAADHAAVRARLFDEFGRAT